MGSLGGFGFRWTLLILDLQVDDEEELISQGKGLVHIDDS
jgi:hypothetical protein